MQGRILHTMLHVADLERSVDFYTRILGMTVLRQGAAPDERRRNVFLGYGPEDATAALELTAYEDGRRYVRGDAYGHLALGFSDVRAACAAFASRGATVLRPPFTIPSGKTIAFLADPDSYEIELVQPA